MARSRPACWLTVLPLKFRCYLGTVTTFDVSKSDLKTLDPVQAENYHLSRLCAIVCARTVLDPSGKLLLVTELGVGLIRIYLLNDDGRLRLTALGPLVAPAGSGRRHGAFLVTLE